MSLKRFTSLSRFGTRFAIAGVVAGLVCACGSTKTSDDDEGVGGAGGGTGGGPTTSTGGVENQAPVGVDDTATVISGLPVSVYVLSNDSDPNPGDILRVKGVTQPANGAASVVPGELQVSYTSNAGFTGTDTFTYTVGDNAGLTAEATVTVTVAPQPTLVITSPTGKSILPGPDIEISFEVNGCEVSPPADNPNGCHVHKFLDGMEYKDTDDTGFGHYTPANFTISPIASGSHDFQLQLIKNDGSDKPFEPLIEHTVTFEVQ